ARNPKGSFHSGPQGRCCTRTGHSFRGNLWSTDCPTWSACPRTQCFLAFSSLSCACAECGQAHPRFTPLARPPRLYKYIALPLLCRSGRLELVTRFAPVGQAGCSPATRRGRALPI